MSELLALTMFVVFVDLAISAIAVYVALGLKLDAWTLRGTSAMFVDLTVTFAPITAVIFWIPLGLLTLVYLLNFSLVSGLDLSDAVRAKLVKNAAKYPAEVYRGKFSVP